MDIRNKKIHDCRTSLHLKECFELELEMFRNDDVYEFLIRSNTDVYYSLEWIHTFIIRSDIRVHCSMDIYWNDKC